MDRRRFVPKPEGLEGRDLLSGIFNNSGNVANNSVQDVPVTIEQKLLRIARTPFYLQELQTGRFLSQTNMRQLQADMASVVGTLHKPNPQALINFNELMRTIAPHATLQASDTAALNHAFTTIIANAGATPQQTASLSQDMVELAHIDSQSRQPVYLATNDYAIVLQTILGVGHPIVRPQQPILALSSGTRTIPGFSISRFHRPTLVGTYGVGNTVGVFAGDTSGGFNSNGVTIQIVSSDGQVVGQSQVDARNGDYRATVDEPLPNGVYTFWVRALDSTGHVSNLSPQYRVKIDSRQPLEATTGFSVPQGPLGVR